MADTQVRLIVSCGTYDSRLLGLEVDLDRVLGVSKVEKPVDEDEDPEVAEALIADKKERAKARMRHNTGRGGMRPAFASSAQIGCIRSMASGGKYLALGGNQDVIKIYNVAKKTEVVTMHAHDAGAITQLAFAGNQHLISSSEDGALSIFRMKDWEALTELRGHDASILSFAIHPSEKALISISKDGRLIMWSLVNGKLVFNSKVKAGCDLVAWSPDGNFYAIANDKDVDVYSAEGGLVCSLKHDKKVLCMQYALDGCIITAGESKTVHVWTITSSSSSSDEQKQHTASEIAVFGSEIHKNRIRGMHALEIGQKRFAVCSCSSDGQVSVYDLTLPANSSSSATFRLAASADLGGTRFTTLSAAFASGSVVLDDDDVKSLADSSVSDFDIATIVVEEGEDIGSEDGEDEAVEVGSQDDLSDLADVKEEEIEEPEPEAPKKGKKAAAAAVAKQIPVKKQQTDVSAEGLQKPKRKQSQKAEAVESQPQTARAKRSRQEADIKEEEEAPVQQKTVKKSVSEKAKKAKKEVEVKDEEEVQASSSWASSSAAAAPKKTPEAAKAKKPSTMKTKTKQ